MENPVKVKSLNFVVSVVQLCCKLKTDQHEEFFSKILLRSGTAVGSDIENAANSETRMELHKWYTAAYNEAIESVLLLKLLRSSDIIEPSLTDQTISHCEELLTALNSIIWNTDVHVC